MATDDPTLQQRLEEVGTILTSGDADRTGNLYTRDGKLMPPGSDFVTGRDAIADFWQGLGDMGIETIEIDPVDVEEYGSAAMRVGLATLRGEDESTVDEIKFIEVWKREGDDWKIHRDIWNSNTSDE